MENNLSRGQDEASQTASEVAAAPIQSGNILWANESTRPYAARQETILFVEDEAFVRGVASAVLRDAGYNVLIAKTAAEAIEIYDRHPGRVDLLLTDIILPGENGRTLGRRLRLKDAALRILLATGYADQMMSGECGEGEECLAKPFSAQGLLQRVRKVIKGNESG